MMLNADITDNLKTNDDLSSILIGQHYNPIAKDNKKGVKPKFHAPTGDTTKERQPLQQSADIMAAGEGNYRHYHCHRSEMSDGSQP